MAMWRGRPCGAPALLLGLLMLAACGASRLVPVDGVAGEAARGTMARKAVGALTLSVQVNAWRGRPEGLDGAFLPVLVSLRNDSPEPVMLRAQDQLVQDDRGGRRRGAPPEDVARQFAEWAGTSRRPILQLDATGPAPTLYRFGLGVTRERGPDLADIAPLAFSEEPIPPGAVREGFLYFPDPEKGWRRIQLLLEWTGGGFARGNVTFEFAAR
jgi:hypothetical protein